MLPLPILNVRLAACHETWQQMTPVAQGHHCAACNRTVLDFTAATQADLDAARAASPDGRVCGRFRPEQLAPVPRLRPTLRRFLVALVLVCGLGLSGREAVAQVQKGTKLATIPAPESVFGAVVEQMPVFEGGQEALLRFIGQNLRWPDQTPLTLSGRVFIQFVIDEQGRVRDAALLKGLHPALDAEAVRVVKLLDGKFTPGMQNNRPVPIKYTLPITFRGTEAAMEKSIPKPNGSVDASSTVSSLGVWSPGTEDLLSASDLQGLAEPSDGRTTTGEDFWAGKTGKHSRYEVMPWYKKEFKGDDLMSFIARNVRWPVGVPDKHIGRKLLVEFVIDERGNVHDARVLKKDEPLFEAEALRVVQLLSGKFEPALVRGKPTPIQYFVKVYFVPFR
ncbi:energy transducer TonB [Hymenobacter weizhouensis]|uniref:energy transducer TonB n=1 Tax=Hymenobacter sp. YIM 151500-1 TaxID=2987689 RepID=UPI002227AFAF|nr:energy transducer TonB [Hymenobacter sp. YIM 151500-1]UYZ62471.1 energy transducer TonB [Hymenobacter sp. YIM 151500-1]